MNSESWLKRRRIRRTFANICERRKSPVTKLKWPFLFQELGERTNADREAVTLTASAAHIRSPSKQRELHISEKGNRH